MNMLEALFYELRPYFLLFLGVYVLLVQHPSLTAVACVLLLLVCSALIIHFRMRARRGTPVEQIFYDLQPALYVFVAGYALIWQHQSRLALASAILLLFCATMILRWRIGHK